MPFSFDAIPDSYQVREDFPRPDWQCVSDWIDTHLDKDQHHQAWAEATAAWLKLLKESLPDHYAIRRSENFVMLTGFDERTTDKLLSYCEHAWKAILKTIPYAGTSIEDEAQVILAFDDSAAYYAYVSDYYPEEGEFGESVGMFIHQDYPHILLNNPPPWYRQRVIAHEMCHLLLSHLPLPLWLNEGITQVVEDILVDGSSFLLDHETLRRHRAYWNHDSINDFWSGDSFAAADEGQELSYNLAQVIVRNLIADYPNALNEIIQSAHYGDAGNNAFQNICQETLGDQIELFLGKGDWEPRHNYPLPGLPA